MTENNLNMEFIPFTAINEFMRVDYRMHLLRTTLQALPELKNSTQASINKLTKKHVKVPGFRNSAKAPATVKAVSMVKAFEKQPKLVAAIISGWCEANPDLNKILYDLLVDLGWKILPPDADRTRLPGFMTQWPEEHDYEFIYENFESKNPDSEYGIDDVSLMAVWLSLRLPINKVTQDNILDLPLKSGSDSDEE